ncbi:glucosaminidase domain-containing protein [Rugamonas sp. DEMB1]|uniref:glucosaminidase domain-containing protein n=1 Tax=Rugamonas sp. DEMB1 TaxID=3039386 RepID=UPI00244AEB34|nr:glucosaminidase domain-containing protein [Rugamonas sp. DEMB1]WGG48373.1 glucosaminidase domain-containing protein [Rugamonas sp. DEMB1]
MRPPEPLRATAATAATASNMTAARPAAALPAAFGNAGGAGFGATLRQLQGEVADFISHGAGAGSQAAAAPALSVEGMALRQRAGGAGAIDAPGNAAEPELRQQFLAAIQPWAAETAERLGVAPHLVAAHAALESGWGQRPLRGAGGADSNNLFGLKAGAGWQGAVAAATTTEYEHGAALKKTEHFRSYPDTASAFRDYANMLIDNPRFQGALNAGQDARAFAQGLARGGYATDPAYADKLGKVAAQLQRGGAKAAAQSGD